MILIKGATKGYCYYCFPIAAKDPLNNSNITVCFVLYMTTMAC